MQTAAVRELSFVVHDLKNPLTAIRIQAELALRQMNETGAGNARRNLKGILSAVEWMNDLVHELLDAQANSVEPTAVGVPEYVMEAVEQLRFLAEQRRMTFDIALAPSLPLIAARRCHALPILLNVLGNAIQYGPTGGTIHISAAARGDSVVVSVRDEGMGLASSVASSLFERGVRGPRSEGHGLGLAIASTRVAELGGRIWVEPAIPHGAVFHFSLPGCEAESASSDSVGAA